MPASSSSTTTKPPPYSTTLPAALTSAPPYPSSQTALLSFPTPEILLVTLNRPTALNAVNIQGHVELDAVWTWFEGEETLRVGIVTGNGRAFCVGMDLKEWHHLSSTSTLPTLPTLPPSGFLGLSLRRGTKPILAAINGACYGGGLEAALNTDLLVASASATFALPEPRVGVIASAGVLERLVSSVGRHRAMQLALTGQRIPAAEMRDWGVVADVVFPDREGGGGGGGGGEGEAEGGGEQDGQSPTTTTTNNSNSKDNNAVLLHRTVRLAREILTASPEAIAATRRGVLGGMPGSSGGVRWAGDPDPGWRGMGGWNMREGLAAFSERRAPVWRIGDEGGMGGGGGGAKL
ncbi:MAG: hypothetical protein M1819_003249 [Sarea resinae]|nr:MAG: hypothetical protein M1819_003249 [Sarea resinae]